MNEILGIENLNIESISLTNFIIGFLLNFILSLFLKYSYLKYSISVSNKNIIANVFPIFSSSIYLIVITIKSSLVLSLGLVGALSIIRFRTAIKETEQIIYFLILTAISIASAANSFLFAIIFSIIIHLYNLYVSNKNFNTIHSVNDQLIIRAKQIPNNFIKKIVSGLNEKNVRVEIISLKKDENNSTLVIRLSEFDLENYDYIETLIKQSKLERSEIQFFSSSE